MYPAVALVRETWIVVGVLSKAWVESSVDGEERCFFEGVIGLGQSGNGSDRLSVGVDRFDGEINLDRSNVKGSVDDCFAGASGEAETDTDSSAALS